MATKTARIKFDFGYRLAAVADQFRELNPNQTGQWPWLPKLTVFFALALLVLMLGWLLILADGQAELEAARDREPVLQRDFQAKLVQAVNLPELRKQKIRVEDYVNRLEKQLPGKAEMDALLSDINQAGIGRGLQFELFRPGQVLVRDYYAELPIGLRVSGRYHDIGAFAADVAKLSRIVTLHNLVVLAPTGKDAGGNLGMEATVRTYRYLDPGEVIEQKKISAKAAAGVRK
jgi:type IV pilus assembly protein PilO